MCDLIRSAQNFYSDFFKLLYFGTLAALQKLRQEEMRGQRGRLPLQPLGYLMYMKAIFRRADVFVLAEVWLPRRPHAGQPRSDV